MATNTTRLALRKPDPSDNVNVTADLSDNYDKIDAAIGFERWTGSFPPSPFTGKAIFRGDLNDATYYWNNNRWVELQQRTQVSSIGTIHTINNNATATPIPNLSLNLRANTAYFIEVLLFYRSATDAPNLAIGFTYPSDAFFTWIPMGIDYSVTSDTGIIRMPTQTGTGNQRVIGTANGNIGVGANPKGAMYMGNTAGTISFIAAQQFATAENTQILAGSVITATRL